MPEFIKTAEVVGNVARTVYELGKFVTERMIPGGWAGLAGDEASRELRDHQLPLFQEGENIIRGEE